MHKKRNVHALLGSSNQSFKNSSSTTAVKGAQAD